MGEWPRGLGRWPVTPEVAGSNPVSPAKDPLSIPDLVGYLFFVLGAGEGGERRLEGRQEGSKRDKKKGPPELD